MITKSNELEIPLKIASSKSSVSEFDEYLRQEYQKAEKEQDLPIQMGISSKIRILREDGFDPTCKII